MTELLWMRWANADKQINKRVWCLPALLMKVTYICILLKFETNSFCLCRSSVADPKLSEQHMAKHPPALKKWVCINGGVKYELISVIKKSLVETNLTLANREIKHHCLWMPCSCYQSSPELYTAGISLLAVYQNMIFWLSEHTEPPVKSVILGKF